MTSKRIVPLSEYHRLPKESLGAEYYKRLLEVVCNNATLALFIMDERQQCVYMNPAAEELTGFTLAEIQGRILHDVIHHTRPDGSPYPLCECAIDRAFPQNNQEQGEEVFVHKDGSFYPVAYTASPIREGENIIGTIIEVRDITQEKLDEQARQDLDKAKTEFFSNVSHEFRTPLTLMLGAVEDALGDAEVTLPPLQHERLDIMQRNGLRLLKLVNTLLDFSRVEANRMQAIYQPTDLPRFTAELASQFQSALVKASLKLNIDCTPLSELVYVDREMWEKIVLNLISNAFKFTFTGGISVRLSSLGDRIELRVEDTGVGIPETELPHLFQRFHRVSGTRSRTYEGSGIGLALVQELVKLHGGTIEVSSQLDRGTTFIVTVPLGKAHLPANYINEDTTNQTRQEKTTRSKPFIQEALSWLQEQNPASVLAGIAPTPTRSVSESSARILVVDDNADLRNYLKRLLSQQYHVETANNGLAALSAIEETIPDLVISDGMMPVMDGFELLRSLRTDPKTQKLPIILLSARAGEESHIEGLEAGADDYLIKPFSARELLARVEAMLKLTRLRQEAETALRESERRFRRLVESNMFGVAFGNFTGGIHYANDYFLKMVGYTREEIEAGQVRWTDMTPPEFLHLDEKAGEELRQKGVASPFEKEYIRKDGTRVPIFIGATLLKDPYNRQQEIISFYLDLSARKQVEAERTQLLQQEKAAREAAESANRIKDEFLAVLSHELRSPLNPILGWSKLLQSNTLNPTKTKFALETIERNARLQAELIEDLLDVSRILRGKLSLNIVSVDLSTIIHSALETVRLAAEAKSIQLQIVLEPEIGRVMGDSSRLQQVVWNLLSNAVKFTPQGGQVQIQLKPMGSLAQIAVSDTGKGIDPEFLPHVFEYFRQENATTTRKFGGLGLGLAIVHHLVELHGGTVQAESEGEGKGATFTVRLPVVVTQPETKPENSESDRAFDLSGIKVLVVDDDTDSREFVGFVLEGEGATVMMVNSAAEALITLSQFQPDILLSDIGMPEMDGYQLMRQVRALSADRGGKIPAIALTAYAGEIDYQLAMSAGFQRHIPKPIEIDELVQAIVSLVAK